MTAADDDAARLSELAERARAARADLREAVATSALRESEIVRATGLARMTVRSWRQARTRARTGA